MTAAALPFEMVPHQRDASAWLFARQEYRRLMSGRVVKVILVMMAYLLLMLPFVLAKPQPGLAASLANWFGAEHMSTKLLAFFWADGAMNKFAMIMGPILAGGIIIDERSRNQLDLLLSKPISIENYFTAKLAAAWGVMATLYLGAVLVAALTFPLRLPPFSLADFLTLALMYTFVVLFAVAFSAWMAVCFRRKLTALLVSFLVLATLSAFAFMGFYYPALRPVMYLNPFFHGVGIIAQMGEHKAADVVLPVAAMSAANALILILGRRAAVRSVRGV